MELRTRRAVLLACATGATATLAGCGGGQGTPGGTDGDGGAGPTTDGSDSNRGTDSGEEDSGDSGSGSETATDEDSEGESGGSTGGAPQLGESVTFPDSFGMTATVTRGGQTVEMSGRFDRENLYWELNQQGQRVEWYLVDDTSYFVAEGRCFQGSLQSELSRDDIDPEGFSEEASANPAIEPAGTDTIEGEEVLVYEVSADAATEYDETLTYYILADSGYLRRIESPSMQWDFHSWGDVEPVEEPDMDCQTMPSGNPTPPG